MLLNGYQPAGEHRMNFTAGDRASGDDLYHLSLAGLGKNFQQTRIMAVLK